MSKRAIFLDRDGTLIVDARYLRDPAQVELLPGVGPALATLQGWGYLLIVVSNQSGIGRGIISQTEAERVHCRLEELLAQHGVRLDAAYYCPHLPEEGCACRKPAIGHIQRAQKDFDIDLPASFIVGDRATDCQTGTTAGCRTILLAADNKLGVAADHVAFDWQEIVQVVASGLTIPGFCQSHSFSNTDPCRGPNRRS